MYWLSGYFSQVIRKTFFIQARKDGNMDEKKEQKKLAMTNTKQEMIQAYNTLLKHLEEKQAGELKPEKRIEEKKTKEAVGVAASLTTEGVGKEIAELKLEIGRTLTRIADQLEGEVNRFVAIRSAIAAKEKELQELYEIEKAAMSLAALIEAQNQKRQEFTAEMETKKEILRQEIDTTRTAWEKEQEEHDAAVKERDTAEKKRRRRSSSTPSNGSSSSPPIGSPTRRPSWRRNSKTRRNNWRMS
jgi:hypothetical protein